MRSENRINSGLGRKDEEHSQLDCVEHNDINLGGYLRMRKRSIFSSFTQVIVSNNIADDSPFADQLLNKFTNGEGSSLLSLLLFDLWIYELSAYSGRRVFDRR